MPRVDIRASVQALAHERLLEARQVWQVLSHANDIGEQRAVLRRFLSAKPAEELRRAAIRRKELTWLIVEMSSAATPDVQPDGWTPEVEAMKPEVTASEGVSATSDLHGGQSGDAEPVMPSLRRYHPDYPITGGLDEDLVPVAIWCRRCHIDQATARILMQEDYTTMVRVSQMTEDQIELLPGLTWLQKAKLWVALENRRLDHFYARSHSGLADILRILNK